MADYRKSQVSGNGVWDTVLLAAAEEATISLNEWKRAGDPMPLKDLWAAQHPGWYEDIDHIECVLDVFTNGTSKRLEVFFKSGGSIKLKVGKTSDLEPGDLVDPATIKAQALTKLGEPKPIVRYDGEPIDLAEEVDE